MVVRASMIQILKLTAFSTQYLRLDDPLPFGLRDPNGRLLLAAGQSINGEQRLSELRGQELYAEESEAADWNRRLAAAVDNAMRQGTSLRAVVAARPDAVPVRDASAAAGPSLTWPEQWQEMASQLDGALRDVQRESDWRSRLLVVHVRARQLFQRRPDASLYCLFHESINSTQHYSCRHALLVLGICEQAGVMFGWPQDWIDSLGRAALTMNVSLMRLQDQLAHSQLPPSPAMMADIEAHADTGAALLEKAGLSDTLCLQVVRMHRGPPVSALPLAGRPPEQQLAALLRRIDVYTAKLSLRASRPGMQPAQAIREACLGSDGKPDEIAGALLQTVGLYPPGSYVELVGGEMAIVLARGRAANQPLVAVLVASNGLPLAVPAQRDCSDRRFGIKGTVAAGTVKVRPSHDKLLALR